MLDKATKHGESTVKTLWSLNGAGWVRMIKKKIVGDPHVWIATKHRQCLTGND